MRLLICTLAALLAAALLAAWAAADTGSTPVTTGCPAGYSLFSVPAPGTSPYRAPGILDNPLNGGNNDGYVCALQLPEAVAFAYCHFEPGACTLLAQGLPLYQFTEDNNPAQGATIGG